MDPSHESVISDPSATTPATDEGPVAQGPTVKIIVEPHDRGTALFAVCGSRVDVGTRSILTFNGATLYWTKKRWSENRSEAAVLLTKADLLVELERAKLAAPFQAKVSELMVEWKRFMS